MQAEQAYATTRGRTGPAAAAPRGRTGGRHRRSERQWGHWRRRLLAYRGIELLASPAPERADEECLLLVHIRRVVGRVTYRACDECAQGVITHVVLDEPFRDSGLGTRALSHLKSQYPDITWCTTLDKRLTRDLLRRMRIPRTTAAGPCPHVRTALAARA
ncbi:hypothetical protein ACF09K_16170 [Streptomyces sp. NPDC014882]|uniref:hypothetical protein n=1 Tax=Streptomyces sp. NPDC014882 TaxID=3364927 RepID=UPI0036F4E2FF